MRSSFSFLLTLAFFLIFLDLNGTENVSQNASATKSTEQQANTNDTGKALSSPTTSESSSQSSDASKSTEQANNTNDTGKALSSPTTEKTSQDSDASKSTEKQASTNETDKATDAAKEEKPPAIGNFALPASQQPAALFGFGGNIIDKGEVQLYFFADEFEGRHKETIDLIPGVLFGVTENLSLFFNFPFTPSIRDGRFRSSGLEDFFIQVEYAFYNKSTYTYTDQATILANITFPTGSIKKNPPTGFGSPSFFIGATYYHTTVDWIVFTAPGAILTTSDHGTKFGDQFLYQFGLGRNLPSPQEWIYAVILEVNGQYNKKNRIDGMIDPNSGGNVIYVTPSLWISSKEFLLQFGISFPVNQNLFGKQNKFDYALNFNAAWSFY